MQIISHSANATINLGRKISRHLKGKEIICLFGQLGSGKTVLSKGIALGMGIKKEEVISPTFVLIREHLKAKIPLYHFDLYRLKQPKDILELGYEEYLYGSGVAVIEWADRLQYLLPEEYLKIELEIAGKRERKIKIHSVGRRYQELYENIRH